MDKKTVPSSKRPIATQITFSGPLPPPETLSKYKDIDPKLVEIIFTMAEEQSKHRQELEKMRLDAQIRESEEHMQHVKRRDSEAKLGQILAFILVLFIVMTGAYVALQGNTTGGSLISALSLGIIIPAFIFGRNK